MKPRLHIADSIILLVILLPFAYLAYVYNSLPAQVPTHFTAGGIPNDYSSKQSMWGILGLMAGVSVFMFLLLRFLPNLDPKKGAKNSATVFNKIAVAVVLLICAINFLLINAAQTGAFKFYPVFPVMMGVFFSFMGNMMHSIKPNYFAGIRTPWTLESEETWRLTHRFGGRLWFFGGLVIAAVCLFLPQNVSPFVLVGGIGVLAIIPVVYSYVIFRSIPKNK